jgi:hypothetical protein
MANVLTDEEYEAVWTLTAKAVIRTEMVRRGMNYADLVLALAEWGLEENERNLRNKVARGTFSASFLLQCLAAMKCTTLSVSDYVNPNGEITLFTLGPSTPSADKLRDELEDESE